MKAANFSSSGTVWSVFGLCYILFLIWIVSVLGLGSCLGSLFSSEIQNHILLLEEAKNHSLHLEMANLS